MNTSSMVELMRWEKRRLRIWIQRETNTGLRIRMLIVLHLAQTTYFDCVELPATCLHELRATGGGIVRVESRE